MYMFVCLGINKNIYIVKKNKKIINIKLQIAFGGGETVGQGHSCRECWSSKCTGNALNLFFFFSSCKSFISTTSLSHTDSEAPSFVPIWYPHDFSQYFSLNRKR